MAWEWVGPTATATVGVAGSLSTIFVARAARLTQREVLSRTIAAQREQERRREQMRLFGEVIASEARATKSALASHEKRITDGRDYWEERIQLTVAIHQLSVVVPESVADKAQALKDAAHSYKEDKTKSDEVAKARRSFVREFELALDLKSD